jgi:hypothetical protein
MKSFLSTPSSASSWMPNVLEDSAQSRTAELMTDQLQAFASMRSMADGPNAPYLDVEQMKFGSRQSQG